MGLLSDLYTTLAKFFRQGEEQGDASKSVATNRLKLVLMQDRTNLTPRILEQMRSELIELLSRYVELDKELLDLNFEQEGDQVALMLSIPVIRAKDEEEIDAAIEEHKKMLAAAQIAENQQEIEVSESVEANDEQSVLSDSENRTEEEQIEIDKTEAIANELQNIPKIIKKKEISAPENLSSSNPFKDNLDTSNIKMESSAEIQ